jgi:hypothetical protein
MNYILIYGSQSKFKSLCVLGIVKKKKKINASEGWLSENVVAG